MGVLLAVLAHAVAAVAGPWVVRRCGVRGFWWLALVPAAVTVWAAVAAPGVIEGRPVVWAAGWIPEYGVSLALRMDVLGLLMVFVVAGVGALVLGYCARYFAGTPHRGLGGFAGVFVAFAGAMLGLVLADDLILLYVFWELTTVFSYLLIGFHAEERNSRRAAITAIIVTTSGGLAMLGGFVLLGAAAGTYRISAILAAPPAGGTVPVALALVLVGALSKSALVPFHFWLPGAMAAPTPVSAYLHAAAMVKAGVYLIARLSPAFADVAPWRPVVVAAGIATMVVGAWRALRRNDLKLMLAFGTVSQLGFLCVLLGYGTRAAALAGLAMTMAHAAFKAALFMVVGVIDHATGTRDLRRLSGLRRAMPATCAVAALAAASMAGLPPLIGFVGKEAAFLALTGDPVALGGVLAGSALTVAYSARFLWGAFGAKEGHAPTEVAHPPGAAFLAPAGLLAAAGLALGAGAPALNAFTAAYVGRYPPGPHDEPLALWHGLTVPLAESALVIAAGALLFRRWRSVPAFRFPLDAEHGYRVIMRGVDRAADQATRFTQRGSLPVYLRSILLALLLLPGGALVSGGPWPHDVRPWQVPAEPAVVALVCAAALAAVLQPRRLGAVVCAGVAGTGTATLYVLYGAPDLGLTQFLTETVTLVAFVLVLRRLPARFGERQVAGIRVVNALFAVAAGLVVAGVALAAVSVRTAVPESALYPQAAERAGGTNIVNIALVDLRAWDTMGESAVLLVAAVGVVGLIYGRRRPTLPRVGDATGPVWAIPGAPRIEEPEAVRDAATWLRGAETLSPERRSILFEVAARLLFHPMLVLSAYLLFSGHGSPGGGFAAGLVTGLALTMRYLAGGRYELAEALPLGPGVCQGIGLAVVAGIGLAGLAISGEVLRQAVLDARLPLLGEVHFTTSTIFDAGVYLVVVGVVLDILRAMGAELDRRVEREHEEVATA